MYARPDRAPAPCNCDGGSFQERRRTCYLQDGRREREQEPESQTPTEQEPASQQPLSHNSPTCWASATRSAGVRTPANPASPGKAVRGASAGEGRRGADGNAVRAGGAAACIRGDDAAAFFAAVLAAGDGPGQAATRDKRASRAVRTAACGSAGTEPSPGCAPARSTRAGARGWFSVPPLRAGYRAAEAAPRAALGRHLSPGHPADAPCPSATPTPRRPQTCRQQLASLLHFQLDVRRCFEAQSRISSCRL